MSLPLISFDAAGTLIQVSQPVGRTYAEFAARHGIQVDETALKRAFKSLWGQIPPPHRPEGVKADDDERSWWQQLAARVFETALGTAIPREVFEPLFDGLYRHFAQPEAWIVFDDVKPVLDDLAQDHALCVLSNFDRRLLQILEGHEMTSYFSHVILSSEVGAAKPHPRMFDTALRLMEATPEESWHVGDDDHCDIQGARVLGWKAFAVSRPEQSLWHLLEKVREK